MYMKFKLYTLVDITESGERKGPDRVAVGQQTNWDTLIQVIGLRANPEPISVSIEEGNIKGFGTEYKGKQRYWVFEFVVPEGSITIDNLQDDFDLVPYISDLTETFANGVHAFLTKDNSKRNIFFQHLDK